ncbi:hypothetical protein [Kitasatospora sp. NPDC018619]|uniref:hypothetical protein n=1 Tax=unclassified Kitasatospora TaxID=2633591 RepID=UPI0037B40F03
MVVLRMWSVLAARTVLAAADDPGRDLFRSFTETWAAWDWRRPVALTDAPTQPGPGPLTVLTPSAPVRSCTTQVGPDVRDLLTEELYRAWELTGDPSADPWPALLAAPPLHRRHAAWAVVGTDEGALGLVRGRLRALLTALEEAGATGLHAWPHPYRTADGRVHLPIGLGPDPLPAARLAPVGEAWSRTLPGGVRVAHAEGGAVPTPSR